MIAHRLVVETLSRDIIDAAFYPQIRRGNLLELFDGLHPPAEVIATIPVNFEGVLDLSCCTSSVFASLLRLERGALLNVIASSESLVPAPQLRLLECVLDLLFSQPNTSYLHARLTFAYALGDFREGEL